MPPEWLQQRQWLQKRHWFRVRRAWRGLSNFLFKKVLAPVATTQWSSRGSLEPKLRLLRDLSGFIQEVSPLLPNPCRPQDYERSLFCPDQPGSEGCPPNICADEVTDEDE